MRLKSELQEAPVYGVRIIGLVIKALQEVYGVRNLLSCSSWKESSFALLMIAA